MVEADEQRYRRLYLAYWGLGAVNAIGKSPEEIAEIDARRNVLLSDLVRLGQRLSMKYVVRATNPAPIGAGDGQT